MANSDQPSQHFYQHTQVAYPILLFMVGVTVGGVFPLTWMTGSQTGFWIELAGFVVLSVLFGSLTVRVHQGTLVWYFGPGIVKNKIDLPEIRSVHVVENPIHLRWGIRSMDRGRSFHAAGAHAVEIETNEGRVVRLGNGEPHHLARVLRRGPVLNAKDEAAKNSSRPVKK